MPGDQDSRVVRTPVGVAQTVTPDSRTGPVAAVVCDDGSVWTRSLPSEGWREMPPIPGTRRALESELEG